MDKRGKHNKLSEIAFKTRLKKVLSRQLRSKPLPNRQAVKSKMRILWVRIFDSAFSLLGLAVTLYKLPIWVMTTASLLFPFSAFAQTSGFETAAPHAVIMDSATGIVLYEKDARRAVAPASMTKILTAEMVFDALREGRITMDTEFKVSEEAWRRGGAKSGGSTMFLKLGSSVRVEDLLRGVIIQSGNDACIVLAEGLAGSETAFADMMTAHARKVGLESVTFRNATGWPHPEHRISTYDLAQLGQRSVERYAEFYDLYSEKDFMWNGIRQDNRNPLLGQFTGADGLKTGHTEVSGYGLVGSAKRGQDRRIIVVNGLDSKRDRREESIRLMTAAFDSFGAYKLYDANDAIGSVDVYMGEVDEIDAIIPQELIAGLYRPDRSQLRTQMRYKVVAAPIAKGDIIADLIVIEPGKPERTIPLVAANDVKRLGAIRRAIRSLKFKIGG